MKKKIHIQQEVEKTMQSLDTMKKAETDPFFYTRLQARLDKREEKQLGTASQGRWQLSLAWVALLLVVVNSFSAVAYHYYQNDEALESRNYYLEEIYQDYELAHNSIYELPLN